MYGNFTDILLFNQPFKVFGDPSIRSG